MFGYIGETSTSGGGHTNRADVNELVYLFGGKGIWLPKTNPLHSEKRRILLENASAQG